MTTETAMPGYAHKQTAPLWLILCVVGVATVALAVLASDFVDVVIAGCVGTAFLLLAFSFRYLAVEDRGDVLAIRFGPLPLFRRSVRYADVDSVEVGRTLLLDGWGIHMSVRGGWVWNLWGRACVVVRFKDGRTLRIGTDDAENLTEFLRSKIGGKGT